MTDEQVIQALRLWRDKGIEPTDENDLGNFSRRVVEGWEFYATANTVAAHFGDNLNTKVAIKVRTITSHTNDPTWKAHWYEFHDEEFSVSSFIRYPVGCCSYCGAEMDPQSNQWECWSCGAN